jgi:hypothetical protein
MAGNLKEDIRFVLWTGLKFLFFGRKDFRNIGSSIIDIFNEPMIMKKDSQFIKFLPETMASDLSVSGSGSLSMTFTAPESKYDFRFHTKRPNSLFRDKLLADFIKPYKAGYYKDFDIFNQDYLDKPNDYGDPTYIFTLPQIVWVDMTRDKDDPEAWKRIFTGTVDTSTETETPGRMKRINFKASNLLQIITKIPLIHQLQIIPFADSILPEDSNFRIFWKVYMLSLYSGAGFIGFDTLAERSLTDLYTKLAKRVNSSVGAVSMQDITDMTKYLNDAEVMKAFSPYQLKPDDLPKYYEIVKANTFYRFKLFDDSDVDEYKGEDNSVPEKVAFSDLFQSHKNVFGPGFGKPPCIGKLKFNKIIKDLENRDLTEQVHPFRKLFKLTMGSMYQPVYTYISNVIRRFSTSYGLMNHTDPFGNWVLEYPNFNAMPKIGSGDDGEIEAYEDNDKRYMFQKFDCTGLTHNINPDKYITYIELPFQTHGPVRLEGIEHLATKFTGRNWAPIKEFLQFGLSETKLNAMYYTVGDLTMKHYEFLGQLTEWIRRRLNAEVYTSSLVTKPRPELQIGRTAVIVHKEKKYLVSSVSHSFDVGTGGTSTLALTHGRSLHEILTNHWQYFLDHVNDIKDEIVDALKPKVQDAVVVQDEEEISNSIEDLSGKRIEISLAKTLFRRMCPYVKLAPGVKVTGKNGTMPDWRLFVALSELTTQFHEWAVSEFPNLVELPIIVISSVWRSSTPGAKTLSRHGFGRAIDINSVLIREYDTVLEIIVDKVYEFDYYATLNPYQRVVPDKLIEIAKGIGFDMNKPEVVTNDVVFWNFDARAGDSPAYADYGHVAHIHMSVGVTA